MTGGSDTCTAYSITDCERPCLHEAVEQATAVDGCVTAADQERLEKALNLYLATGQAPPRPGETGAGAPANASAPLS